MAQQDDNDRDFKLQLNLSGVRAADGTGKLPDGLYKGKVIDMYMRPEKTERIVVVVEVAEGPYAGLKRTTGLNVPKEEKDAASAYFRAFAESCGIGPDKLDKGVVTVGPKSFLNKGCFFEYINKNETSEYDQVRFLREATYDRLLAIAAENPASASEGVTVRAAARKPAAAGKTLTKAAVAATFDDDEEEEVEIAPVRGRKKADAAADLEELL